MNEFGTTPRDRSRLRRVSLVVALLVGSTTVADASVAGAHPTIAGTACNKAGQVRKVRRVTYTCVTVRSRRIWRAGKASAQPGSTTVVALPPSSGSLVAASQCRLSDPNAKPSGISLGFPRLAERLKSTGTVRIGVVFVDFPDAVASRTTQSVLSLISPDAERRYSAMSYGAATFQLVPVQRWLRMSRPSGSYAMSRSNVSFASHRDFVSEAINLSSGLLEVGGLDGFLVVANPDAAALDFGPAFTPNDSFWAASAGGRTWMNGASSGTDLLTWGSAWFNHEFGHAMGLVDLYAFDGAANRFVGGFSLMGIINGGAPEFFGWERWSLGWLDDSQVACLVSSAATVDLDPVARPGGTKVVVAKLGPSRALVVESRRRLGYDSGLSKEGALVYVVDTSVRSGQGVIRVLPINDSDTSKMSAALGAGESLSYGGVSVVVATSGPNGVRVTVRFD